jgi:hypothetical protein
MEPAQVEVIVHTSTVTNVEPRGPENWVFSMDNMYGLWLVGGKPCLSPGDRVRITITKEPSDDRS